MGEVDGRMGGIDGQMDGWDGWTDGWCRGGRGGRDGQMLNGHLGA